MPTIRNRFYPLSDLSQHDVLSLYSTMQTGVLAGTLVKIVTGAANPATLATDGWSPASVGAQVAGAYSYRYETKMKVTPTVSGDTSYNALGLALLNTLEFDENQQPLRYNERRAKEIGAVISGETVPIATRGMFGIWGQYIDQSMGNVQPGNVVVVSRSGNGLIAAVDPTNPTNFGTGSTSFIYTPAHVIGKWLTSLPTSATTGVNSEFSAQGGFALLQLDANL
jgi:hypothetical protein